jgi:hypothetical protein
VIPRNEAGEYGPTAIKDALKDLEDAIAMCGKRVGELATKRERELFLHPCVAVCLFDCFVVSYAPVRLPFVCTFLHGALLLLLVAFLFANSSYVGGWVGVKAKVTDS